MPSTSRLATPHLLYGGTERAPSSAGKSCHMAHARWLGRKNLHLLLEGSLRLERVGRGSNAGHVACNAPQTRGVAEQGQLDSRRLSLIVILYAYRA